MRHGYGTMSYPSGNTYEGQWKDDSKSGFGIMIWKDLDEVYTGYWLQDKPHGYGEHIWGESTAKTIKKQHCNLYRGDFQDGKRHGKGSFFYMNGSQYTGYWENDLKHGAGVFVHPDGRITSGDYELNRMITFEPETATNLPPSPTMNFSKPPPTASTMNGKSRPGSQMSTTVGGGGAAAASLLSKTMNPISGGSTMGNTGSGTAGGGRATEDISPQYHLNIMDVLMSSYPMPAKDRKGKSMEELTAHHKRTISEIERILLKYNQYLKLVYKRYNESANRQRQRQQAMSSSSSHAQLLGTTTGAGTGAISGIPLPGTLPNQTSGSKPPNPPPNNNQTQAATNAALAAIFIDESSRWNKIVSATKQARAIHKRFYCSSLEQILRSLRELDIIGTYFNAFDFVKVFKAMRMEHLRVARDQYRQFIRDHFAHNPPSSSSMEQGEDGIGENKEVDDNNTNPMTISTVNDSIAPQPQLSEEEQKAMNAKMNEEIEYILGNANISIGKLLDDYEDSLLDETSKWSSEDVNFFNYYYYHAQWNQPVLEHEFVELFVRCVAESYGRRGINEQYLTLNQAVEKTLAQKVKRLLFHLFLVVFICHRS
jgi:hypothetical protein